MSINVEGGLSLGFSMKLRGAVVVGSTKDKIDDIPGTSLIGKDGYNGTVAVCVDLCFGVVPGVDENRNPNSKGYLFGFGEGYDVSANLISVSDYLFNGDAKNKTLKWQLPIANKNFLKKLPFVGPILNKYFPD